MNGITEIIKSIAAIKSTDDLFNHYSEAHPGEDGPDAPRLKRENLALYLSAFEGRDIPYLLVGESPSRFGARWSGVPYTHQSKLGDMAKLLGIEDAFHRPVAKQPPSGPSGTSELVWRVLNTPPPLLWNIVMQHQFKYKNGELRNRNSILARDRDSNREAFSILVRTFQPKLIIFMGTKAWEAGEKMGFRGKCVRHPARGGGPQFLQQMTEVVNY
jgi:hypothetical protein